MAGRFYLQDLLRPASPARAGSCFAYAAVIGLLASTVALRQDLT
jgi:hypothetical protein